MSDQSNLNSLFENSGLEDTAVQGLTLTVENLGTNIMAGLGNVNIDTIDRMGATEVLLLKLLIDDSYSIQAATDSRGKYVDNSPLIIEGHNLVLSALKASKSAGAILVSCSYLNGTVLYPFVPLDLAVQMSNKNYSANGGTPLYDMTAVALSSIEAKRLEIEQGGIAVRAVTYVITDGADMHSHTHHASSVAAIISGLLGTESHIIGAMGIDDGGRTDFRAVFSSMGIPAQWVLTPGNNESEIRRAFGTISQSAVRTSQGAGSFSQTALGGFGT